MRKIILTGGGSAGHVIPNVALIPELTERGWEIFYFGSKKGIEREIIAKTGVRYFPIASGKLRRYFSWRNFIVPLQILAGVIQAFILCRRIKPQVIFSKGGFVGFPVVVAAWLNRIPVVAHESDLTPGLANKLSLPFVNTICITFPVSRKFFSNKKRVEITGNPLRKELLAGDAERGRQLCGFTSDKKILLVLGGGLGATTINRMIHEILPQLLPRLQIVHICGRGKAEVNRDIPGYQQFEYLYAELADVMACADIVLSRAGANSLYELLSLQKPHLLIPLPTGASRGDQLDNARYFMKQGLSQVLWQEELSAGTLIARLNWLLEHVEELKERLQGFKKPDSVGEICDILDAVA